LTSVGGSVYINYNPSLQSLSELENVNYIGGSIDLSNNISITDLFGFDGLSEIIGYLRVKYNDQLVNLNGLQNVTSIGQSLIIGDNNKLSNFMGLDSIVTIGGGLSIDGNTKLFNINKLQGLVSVGGFISITHNPILYSLTGLDSVSSIDGPITISNNNILHSLSGLDNIDPVSITGLYVHNNAELSTCEVRSVCEYMEIPDADVMIRYNKSGCDEEHEVELACLTVSETEIVQSPDFLIYPVPAKENLTISYSMKTSAMIHISINNIQGKVVKEIPKYYYQKGLLKKRINIEDLVQGIYIIKVKTGVSIINKKIVVL